MLSASPRCPVARLAAVSFVCLIWAASGREGLGEWRSSSGGAGKTGTSPRVSRQVEPAAAHPPNAPPSVIRMGQINTAAGSAASPEKVLPLSAPLVDDSPEADTPGRIQPHNPQPVTGVAKKLVDPRVRTQRVRRE